jgi:hypothetical protein
LREISLEPGDAILFDATSVEHYTSPLVASSPSAQPMRVTAVMRFYFA